MDPQHSFKTPLCSLQPPGMFLFFLHWRCYLSYSSVHIQCPFPFCWFCHSSSLKFFAVVSMVPFLTSRNRIPGFWGWSLCLPPLAHSRVSSTLRGWGSIIKHTNKTYFQAGDSQHWNKQINCSTLDWKMEGRRQSGESKGLPPMAQGLRFSNRAGHWLLRH